MWLQASLKSAAAVGDEAFVGEGRTRPAGRAADPGLLRTGKRSSVHVRRKNVEQSVPAQARFEKSDGPWQVGFPNDWLQRAPWIMCCKGVRPEERMSGSTEEGKAVYSS